MALILCTPASGFFFSLRFAPLLGEKPCRPGPQRTPVSLCNGDKPQGKGNGERYGRKSGNKGKKVGENILRYFRGELSDVDKGGQYAVVVFLYHNRGFFKIPDDKDIYHYIIQTS